MRIDFLLVGDKPRRSLIALADINELDIVVQQTAAQEDGEETTENVTVRLGDHPELLDQLFPGNTPHYLECVDGWTGHHELRIETEIRRRIEKQASARSQSFFPRDEPTLRREDIFAPLYATTAITAWSLPEPLTENGILQLEDILRDALLGLVWEAMHPVLLPDLTKPLTINPRQ